MSEILWRINLLWRLVQLSVPSNWSFKTEPYSKPASLCWADLCWCLCWAFVCQAALRRRESKVPKWELGSGIFQMNLNIFWKIVMIMGHNLSLKITWTGLKYAAFLSIKRIIFLLGPWKFPWPTPWKIPWPMEISMPTLNGRPWNFPWGKDPYVSLDSRCRAIGPTPGCQISTPKLSDKN